MGDDALEQLRRENPVPGPMPGLPIEPVLRRLDDGPAAAAARSSARPRRARKVIRALPVAVSAIVVVAVATVAISIGGQHRSSGSSSRPGSSQAGAATSAASYFLDYLLPRNGADWAAGSRLTDFTRKVRTKAETTCLTADGLPGPPVYGQPSQRFGSEDFPNMPVIKSTSNVGVTTVRIGPTNPAKSLSPAKREAYTTALTRCEASAPTTTVLSDNPQANTLMDAWMTIFSRVSASPAIRAANRRAASCSRATPFPASTVGSEIETIEAKLTPLNIRGQNAQANATNANGVQVLTKCFGTVETLRDRLMATQRVRFLAQHAQAIRQIENQVNRVVAADEAKYGVKLGAAATG
jgi:hypothetical protein